ncbi:hypothetical protein ACFSBZ_16925 [Amnibacterium flavum]|uniref:hypothetical protein n=1 Tax=Amnibacterium flavum TaxID=2173173 RepID=UPI000E31EC9B|nr:hypothetical protein [Amnibacterium flavum]
MFGALVGLVLLPLLLPWAVVAIVGTRLTVRTSFWLVGRWRWLYNTLGALAVAALVTVEVWLLAGWIGRGEAAAFFDGGVSVWGGELLSMFGWWLLANFAAGGLLIPLALSIHRRRVATMVRNRRVSDVLTQTRIEQARKRAADMVSARRIGVNLDPRTGRITGTNGRPVTSPMTTTGGAQAFGFVSRATVKNIAERFYDVRQVRDWVDEAGRLAVLPRSSSSVRALLIAESGTGKTVLLNGLILCALVYKWPIVFIDAKGDPADAEALAALAKVHGRTADISGGWDFFNGTADQVTAKLMRLMPAPDGANQHYLDEIRGVLQAVQDSSPIRGVDDLRERLTRPAQYVRDQYDQQMVTHQVDRDGTTAGQRALQSLLVALRPLEKFLAADGWSYAHPKADVTIVPLSPVDDAQARLGDLLLMDLRNYLSTRLERRDKSPMVVIVDEFPQLVTGTSDPGDTAGSLFETARSAGMGLVLATQSPAGLSNDEVRRRRALSSGAALIFGRSKDPEDVVKYAGTVMQMEASGAAAGDELRSARAQHTYVIPPQDVREAADGSFWIVQGGAIASFRAFPNASVDPARTAATGTTSDNPQQSRDEISDADVAEVDPHQVRFKRSS